jgi:hypothetical protein
VETDDGLYKRIGLFYSYENHELFEAQDKVQITII